jgi:hypothetical protein
MADFTLTWTSCATIHLKLFAEIDVFSVKKRLSVLKRRSISGIEMPFAWPTTCLARSRDIPFGLMCWTKCSGKPSEKSFQKMTSLSRPVLVFGQMSITGLKTITQNSCSSKIATSHVANVARSPVSSGLLQVIFTSDPGGGKHYNGSPITKDNFLGLTASSKPSPSLRRSCAEPLSETSMASPPLSAGASTSSHLPNAGITSPLQDTMLARSTPALLQRADGRRATRCR